MAFVEDYFQLDIVKNSPEKECPDPIGKAYFFSLLGYLRESIKYLASSDKADHLMDKVSDDQLLKIANEVIQEDYIQIPMFDRFIELPEVSKPLESWFEKVEFGYVPKTNKGSDYIPSSYKVSWTCDVT